MKILLLGDASNYHHTLGNALSRKGHDVTVASSGSSWMRTARDIDLSRKNGKLGGALLQLRLNTTLRNHLKGYDIVQLCDTSFISLRPNRQLQLVKHLKKNNGHIILCALGDNPIFIKSLIQKNPPLKYSEWQAPWGKSIDSQIQQWLSDEMLHYASSLLSLTDGITTALYEYHKTLTSSSLLNTQTPIKYVGIPIDIPTSTTPTPKYNPNEKIKIFFASHIGREASKGADILLPMLRQLQADRPNRIKIITPPNLPFSQFLTLLDSADIVCDQLYSYTPATTALLAMARGAIAITGGEKEYYQFIGHNPNSTSPIFNPDPRNLQSTYQHLLQLIDNPHQILSMQKNAKEFVKKHNDASTVADKTLELYNKVIHK